MRPARPAAALSAARTLARPTRRSTCRPLPGRCTCRGRSSSARVGAVAAVAVPARPGSTAESPLWRTRRGRRTCRPRRSPLPYNWLASPSAWYKLWIIIAGAIRGPAAAAGRQVDARHGESVTDCDSRHSTGDSSITPFPRKRQRPCVIVHFTVYFTGDGPGGPRPIGFSSVRLGAHLPASESDGQGRPWAAGVSVRTADAADSEPAPQGHASLGGAGCEGRGGRGGHYGAAGAGAGAAQPAGT